MLIGEYDGKLTEKNRLAIPKKIRDEMQEEILLSRGYEGCLILLDKKRWLDLQKIMELKPVLDLSARDTKRFILGGAYEIELDKQGRFVLPSNLKEYANIFEDVVFLGIGNWVEIWGKEMWDKKLDNLINNASDIAEQLLKENGRQ